MKTLGLYLHIPFCRIKCGYCDFYSIPGERRTMDGYLAALRADLAQWGEKAGDYLVDTVYLGGGTPSWFGGERIAQVMEQVKASFRLTDNCEITMEANPDSVDEALLSDVRTVGVNRLSLGIQSAGEEELKTAGRPHSFAQGVKAVELARRAGFSNLSLDLIYGLPGQTMAGWQRSVEEVLGLEPEHLSLYGLKVEEGTAFHRQRENLNLPDDDFQADCYLWACQRLRQEGFVHYEISNFARSGFESRHNLKYWTLGEYLGFGPAAHSDFGGVRFGNQRNLAAYLAGSCPRCEEQTISPQQRREEYLMLGLRTGQGISQGEFAALGGEEFSPLEDKLIQMAGYGLCRKEGGRWSLTDQGFLLSNSILVELLERLEEL